MEKKLNNASYTLFIGKDCQYYFNLKAGNHEIILQSEGYTTKQNALKGIQSVQENCTEDDNYERKIATDSSPYFVLKAKNGEPIGKSEMYSSEQMMENGISSVKKNGVTEMIKEDERKCVTISVNTNPHKVREGTMTGSDILKLEGYSSDKYSLFQIKGTEQIEITSNETVSIIDGLEFQAIVSNIKFG